MTTYEIPSEQRRNRRPAGSGRKSKGDRHLIASRVPRSLAEVVMDRADALDISISECVADLLEVAVRYAPPVNAQEALPMADAS